MIYYTYLILFGCSLHVNYNEAFAEFSWNVRYYTVIRPPSSTMFCWGHRILPTQRVSDPRKKKLVDWLVIPRCHETAWKSSAFETGSILLNLCLVCWTIQICAKLRWTNWIKYYQASFDMCSLWITMDYPKDPNLPFILRLGIFQS